MHKRPDLPGHLQPVEDYTTPFLIVFGVLVWIALVATWAGFGMLGAIAGAFLADRAIHSFS